MQMNLKALGLGQFLSAFIICLRKRGGGTSADLRLQFAQPVTSSVFKTTNEIFRTCSWYNIKPAKKRFQPDLASWTPPSTSTHTTSGSMTSSSSKLPKTMFYISSVSREIIGNCLRYVRGLQVLLVDNNNANQADYQNWACHILKGTHGTCFISNFSRKID